MAGAILYTIVASARRRGLDLEAYLTDIIRRLPTTPATAMHTLTPAAWAAEQKRERPATPRPGLPSSPPPPPNPRPPAQPPDFPMALGVTLTLKIQTYGNCNSRRETDGGEFWLFWIKNRALPVWGQARHHQHQPHSYGTASHAVMLRPLAVMMSGPQNSPRSGRPPPSCKSPPRLRGPARSANPSLLHQDRSIPCATPCHPCP